MKVRLKADVSLQAENLVGWLSDASEYVVLSVECIGNNQAGFRIESDDAGTPVVFPIGLFEVCDPVIPTSWVATSVRGGVLGLGPAAFQRENFWERFFDREPDAVREYRAARDSSVSSKDARKNRVRRSTSGRRLRTQEVATWHAGFVQSLEEVSDIEAQKAAWVDRANAHFPGPAELICQVFDDSGVGDLLAHGRVFSETTDAALRRLSVLAERLDLHQSPERVLSSEGWLEFAREAARVLALVRVELAE